MMPVLSATPMVNAAIAHAKSLPDLIKSLPPSMAAQLETKPLAYSKTIYGTALASIVGLVAAKYGVGLDNDTDQLISGCIVLAVTTIASACLRAITKQPIAGIFATPPGTPPAVEAPTKPPAP